jgi:hypothetical protein
MLSSGTLGLRNITFLSTTPCECYLLEHRTLISLQVHRHFGGIHSVSFLCKIRLVACPLLDPEERVATSANFYQSARRHIIFVTIIKKKICYLKLDWNFGEDLDLGLTKRPKALLRARTNWISGLETKTNINPASSRIFNHSTVVWKWLQESSDCSSWRQMGQESVIRSKWPDLQNCGMNVTDDGGVDDAAWRRSN